MNNIRVAWVLSIAWYYWHPLLSNCVKLFPNTKVFTALFPAFAKGFENSFDVEVVGEQKFIETKSNTSGYGSGFTMLSPKIINKLLEFKPNLVFADSFRIWTLLALLLKPIGRWRVILSYEGSSPGVDYRNSKLRIFLRQAMVKAADACVTNSRAGYAYLTEILGASSERVFTIPYEVPDAKSLLGSTTDKIEIPSYQRPIFLFVGHLVTRKGLHLLLQACHLLKEQGYYNYTLLVVGDGEQKQESFEFIQNHNLATNVHLLGRMDYSSLGAYFRMIDAFILPTLEDTWGMVVLEAMLFGKPVLCSKWAGAAEMITDGENGYVFDPNHPEELAKLMSWLIDNPNQIPAMGEKSKHLMSKYTPEAAAESLAKVVEVAFKG